MDQRHLIAGAGPRRSTKPPKIVMPAVQGESLVAEGSCSIRMPPSDTRITGMFESRPAKKKMPLPFLDRLRESRPRELRPGDDDEHGDARPGLPHPDQILEAHSAIDHPDGIALHVDLCGVGVNTVAVVLRSLRDEEGQIVCRGDQILHCVLRDDRGGMRGDEARDVGCRDAGARGERREIERKCSPTNRGCARW